jgi:hypothetical protein
MGEPGQDVVAAPVQGPSELGEFVQAGRDAVAETLDDRDIAALPRVLSGWR